MRIERTSGLGSGFGVDRRAPGRRVEPSAEAPRPGSERREEAAGRALVVTERRPVEGPAERLVRLGAHAPFLAQLLAVRDDLPETRRRRRAEPARAARAYRDAMEGVGLLVPGYLVDARR